MRLIDDEADRLMTGASGVIAYLPRVLLYPFRGFGLPVLLLLWILSAFGQWSRLVLMIETIWIAHYAIRVIEHTSYGHALPPQMKGDAMGLADSLTLAAYIGPLVIAACLLHEQLSPAGWEPFVAGAVAVLLPAQWLVLATTRSFFASLNPLQLGRVVWVTSPTYVALFVVAWLVGTALQRTDGVGPQLFATFAWVYLTFAGAHLLGFLAYRHHEELGIAVRVAAPTRQRELEAEQARILDVLADTIEARCGAGDLPGAGKAMFAVEPGPADAHRFHEELLDRLKRRHRTPLVLAQSARMITFLLDRRMVERALELFQDGLDLDDRFRPESPLQYEALLEKAIEARRDALVQRLLVSAKSSFPDDPALRTLDCAEMRFLMEIRKDDAAALAVLEAIPNVENHPHATRLRAYVGILRAVNPGSIR